MNSKGTFFHLISILFIPLLSVFAQTGVDTRLTFVSNTFDTPIAGQGTLVIDVEARSLDAVSYDINTFQDAFQLDATLRAQYVSSAFSNQLFPSAAYTTNEDYRASDGRVRYVYTYYTSTRGTITTDWTIVVRFSIVYTLTSSQTTVSWFTGIPNYDVSDLNDVSRLGAESAIPAELTDASLPVQMSNVSAAAFPGEGIVLKWSTESETNSAGFHVWRSQSENGTYKKITTALIASAGNGSGRTDYRFIDVNAADGKEYWYKIEEISNDGAKEFFGPISVTGAPLPTEYSMPQNYPNPFNPQTTVKYELPETADVSVKVYTLLGKEVATLVEKIQNAGRYTVKWNGLDANGRKLSTGVYFVRMQAGAFSQIRKMTFVQ